jgi:hypothetical protein
LALLICHNGETPVYVVRGIRPKQTVVEEAKNKPGRWLKEIAVTVEIEGDKAPALIAQELLMMVAA